MNVYEMGWFLRGKCMPRDILVNESTAEYLVRKLNEATTVKVERDALAVENAVRGEIIERLIGIFGASGCHALQNSNDPCNALMYDAMQSLKSKATDAALAAIELRTIERFADVMHQRAIDTSDSQTKSCQSAAEMMARCYIATELREGK